MPKREKPKTNKSRNDDRKNGKAFKTEGARRNRKNPQSTLDLVLMGKGPARSMKHVNCSNWRGVENVAHPADPEQAAKNKILYPWLFRTA